MLTALTDDLWAFEDHLRLPGGMMLPCRTTIVRLADGRLVVHSPLAIDDARAAAIESLGDVAFLVAPSCIHFLFLAKAAARWPKARVLGAPGLEKKKELGVAFEPLESKPFGDELRMRAIGGVPYIHEHVFLFRDTLVVTDLVFNVDETLVKGLGMQLFFRATGTWNRTAQSRIWRVLAKDRARAAADVAAVLAWDFDRVVMAHGTVIDEDAKPLLTNALAWLTP